MDDVRAEKPIPELPPGDAYPDTYAHARNEWDNRIMDASSQAKAWRWNGLIIAGLLGLSIWFNYKQATELKIVPWAIERDALGNPVAKRLDIEVEPTEANVASALMRWVRLTRTISVDAEVLRTNIIDAYKLTLTSSPAATLLTTGYRANDPFDRAKIEAVSITKIRALPMSTGADPTGAKTVRVEWTELTIPRDGSTPPSEQVWVASITYRHIPPQTSEDIEINPDGIYVVDANIQKV